MIPPSGNVTATYKGFGDMRVPPWHTTHHRRPCLISVAGAFGLGLLIGVLIPVVYFRSADGAHSRKTSAAANSSHSTASPANLSEAIENVFFSNSYAASGRRGNDTVAAAAANVDYPTVSFIDKLDGSMVDQGIYWGNVIERRMPRGFGDQDQDVWRRYIDNRGVVVKMERGCGRMQNRLVTFQDGTRGCVRYRQNTDQIQGELFSFYLAQIMGLKNLAPSTVSVVNLKEDLFKKTSKEMAAAQWNSNRPVVLTQFVTNLDSADIPVVFKPSERHLNKHDVLNMTGNGQLSDDGSVLRNLVELAQWSDLIIFDYLTANLDRIVNNLYNYQWNVNIMDAPAHNLAKKIDNDLLVFLDNESGLLHGYRLLKKYEIYHRTLLDNLCMFRKSTADVIKRLKRDGNVGQLLNERFQQQTSDKVKEVLPTLPEKSVKTLNERIDRVHEQLVKCENVYGRENT